MRVLVLFLGLYCSPALAMDGITLTFDPSYGLAITEVEAGPKLPYRDDDAEYFEITNLTDYDIDLSGLSIGDDVATVALVASDATSGTLVLSAGDTWILGKATATLSTAGFDIDYPFHRRMYLDDKSPDRADFVAIYDGDTIVAKVSWSIWPLDEGHALTLDRDSLEEADDPAYWCSSTTDMGWDNYGTPDAENELCALDEEEEIPETDEDVDEDDDGHNKISAGGDDCDDTDPDVHPGAMDEAEDAPYAASSAPRSDQGLCADGTTVPYSETDSRSDVTQALACTAISDADSDGVWSCTESDASPPRFYSLGFPFTTDDAWILLDMPCPVQDGEGDDLVVFEKTFAFCAACTPYPEEDAEVYALNSETLEWVYVGAATNLPSADRPNVGTQLDLSGLDLPEDGVSRFLIRDVSDPSLFEPTADGFDLTGFYALHDCPGDCDGVDNNCDGTTDGGFSDGDGDGVADCVEPEICDGLDNDGDGEIDEGYPDTDGDGIADCLECETCDGLDNDGDGIKDNGFRDQDGDGIADCVDDDFCSDCLLEICVDDSSDTAHDNHCVEPEQCDGADNDEDGYIDEDFPDTDMDGIADCLDCEECDGLDNNGDGEIDEGYPDTDGDGIADCLECETCDGLDNDGDGIKDNGFRDQDGDGIADCVDDDFCSDCEADVCIDDSSDTEYDNHCVGPEQCDGADNDEDGYIDEDFPDADGDGIADCMDCEECDGLDNNGDGYTDEGYPDTDKDGIADCVECEDCDGLDNDGDGIKDNGFRDQDGDGIADCVDDDFCSDCEADVCIDDSSDTGYDNHCVGPEQCDGADNDEDGYIDEDFPDTDMDGIADCLDCEECDGLDNDGDGEIDEGYPDADGDGYIECEDCNDGDPATYPGAPELCDGDDNNCDGVLPAYELPSSDGYLKCASCKTEEDHAVWDCGGPGSGTGSSSECTNNRTNNPNGCSAAYFKLWCHRRDGKKNYLAYLKPHQVWVDEACDGTVTTDYPIVYKPTEKITYLCTDSRGTSFKCKTPLVLVFPGEVVQFQASRGWFDLGDMSPADRTDWPSPATPWLAMDGNGNGRIDDGAELFGSATQLPEGGVAQDGFEALAALDADGDGKITPRDPAWQHLLVWSDWNGDRRSTPAELEPAWARGVLSLSLDWRSEPRCDSRGNCADERAPFRFVDTTGRLVEGEVVDVHLAVR